MSSLVSMRASLWLMTCLSVGCASILELEDGIPDDARAGGAGGVGGGSGVVGGGGVGGGGVGGGGVGGDGSCGDGVIDPPEECDDGNADANDGCTDCTVVCSGSGETVDGPTHHCYLAVQDMLSWDDAQDACEAWGGDLLALSTTTELQFAAGLNYQGAWTGGNDRVVEDDFMWSNGEPWFEAAWFGGEPNGGDGANCLSFHSTAPLVVDEPCGFAKPFVCERHPPER